MDSKPGKQGPHTSCKEVPTDARAWVDRGSPGRG